MLCYSFRELFNQSPKLRICAKNPDSSSSSETPLTWMRMGRIENLLGMDRDEIFSSTSRMISFPTLAWHQ